MKLKTISVHKTTIPQLNWLVAVCIGLKPNLFIFKTTGYLASEHNYATNWAQGGPIIEREEIGVRRNAPCSDGRQWEATPSITAKGAGGKYGYGPTPLSAAMRCYVASTLGETVEVPEEL